MRYYTIVTDSSCDLPASLAEKLGIRVVPLSVFVEGKQYYNYLDGRDISFEDFYQQMGEGKMVTTSAVNVEMFKTIMESELLTGHDVLYIGFSSGLSGTYNAGRMAAAELQEEYPNSTILTVDSLCASLGQGMLVYQAALQKAGGKSIEEVRDFCEETKLKVCHWFTVDDLHQLKRGGRISGATALIGTMLNIKPVLHVDNEGKLINMTKARGRNGAIQALVDQMEKAAIEPEKQTIFISQGNCYDEAKRLAELVHERFGCKSVINFVGPTIAAHSGQGTLALFFIGTER
ncbi:MAG: DegV family protein [Candidatus Onthomonas sp.]|nr:DegV family protein [Candidatus Onthomonas sp.]